LHTSCKPTGKAEIDGQLYTVITNGDFIERSTEIYVSNVDGNSIIVKERGK